LSALVFRERRIPDVGEIVVARITKVFDLGAYASLEEFEGLPEAYIPWNEVTTRHVQDIKSLLKVGQIVVGKVIRVDKKKNPPQIDISLKRVFDNERRVKIMRWKREQKAQKIVELTAKKLGLKIDEAYHRIWIPLKKVHPDVLSILEIAVVEGVDPLVKAGLDPKLAEALLEEARKHVEVKTVSISAELRVRTFKGDGVERLKKLFTAIEDYIMKRKTEITKFSLYLAGSPRYVLILEGRDYKTLEKVLKDLTTYAEALARDLGIDEISITRREKAE